MRILHFADLHLGVETYGKTDPRTGLSTRLLDFLRALDELVEYAVAERVDLVLFDIRMPTLSGTETLKRIRANDKTSRLPVVMVTASTELADMLKCVDEGADGYATKPVDIGWVSTCVHSAIETRRLGVAMPLR